MQQQFMLLPSMACQARCSYCFGPNRGTSMSAEAFTAAVEWIKAFVPAEDEIHITFHGGEPLLAGKAWYRKNLPALRQQFADRLKLSIQSNLWLLDDEFCALFREQDVSVGTSLDGPEKINDAQRGVGYYKQTMAGIETARRNGLEPGVICTFTALSAPMYRQVFDFFAGNSLSFSVHEAVSTIGCQPNPKWAMQPEQAEKLMIDLFDLYLENIQRIRISTFDSMARGLSAQSGGICTFGDCLGNYLTVAPGGEIFTCNRFAYLPEWQVGTVFDKPDLDRLAQSPAWQKLKQREDMVTDDCGDCTHFAYCKGGCPYNAFSSGVDRRDTNCTIYKILFDHITDRALEEVFSDENLQAVIQHGPGKDGLLRKGRLLQVMRDGLHPKEAARKARETVAAAALGCSETVEEAVDKLEGIGIVTRREVALTSLKNLRTRLDTQSRQGLVNAYLHVTYACNLGCSHCYAEAGPEKTISMAAGDVHRLGQAAATAGFRKIVITGGEPMAHPQRDELLGALAVLRTEVKPAAVVLRTNLAYPLSTELAARMAASFDQVVVSVDGDQTAHDARRGAGSYTHTVSNLSILLSSMPANRLMLTAVLLPEQMEGIQGQAVRDLGAAFGVKVRFKSILPVGRGQQLELIPGFYNSLDDNAEQMAASSGPVSTCGLGMNLFIGPQGECFPCYALMDSRHRLGNAIRDGLPTVLAKNDRYRLATVDTNEKCRTCTVRYLCGGFCRAWSVDGDQDSPPLDCSALQSRATMILDGALEVLEIPAEKWGSVFEGT
ncbi:MAG TPA: TIGR04083 family peptide-modifying radical SAM enzyme [Longilinea sp.]|nr:TIGR04083 family peptide-modifying radical SAM enzyme [Longilinea sp.]